MSPKGITLNSYTPLSVLNAVFSLSSSLIGIWKNPEAASSELKTTQSLSRENRVSIRCGGNPSGTVTLFIALASKQGLGSFPGFETTIRFCTSLAVLLRINLLLSIHETHSSISSLSGLDSL